MPPTHPVKVDLGVPLGEHPPPAAPPPIPDTPPDPIFPPSLPERVTKHLPLVSERLSTLENHLGGLFSGILEPEWVQVQMQFTELDWKDGFEQQADGRIERPFCRICYTQKVGGAIICCCL